MTELILPEGPLVTPQWVNLYKNHPRLCIVEARMKPVGAQEKWESGFKIPGAVMMDINEDFSEKETDLPHMMPSEAYFSASAQQIGLNEDSVIVLYDQVGTYGSARAWWMFRVMGHERVVVLDGGFPAWRDAGLPEDAAVWPQVETGNFNAVINGSLLFKWEDIVSVLGNRDYQIMDARSQGRFEAKAPEPRPGLRGGHIPGSVCLPFQQVQDGIYMKSKEELQAIFEGFDLENKNLVMSCGSGVTASILALAAEIAGYKNTAVYDGSWAEWGMPNEEWPVEV